MNVAIVRLVTAHIASYHTIILLYLVMYWNGPDVCFNIEILAHDLQHLGHPCIILTPLGEERLMISRRLSLLTYLWDHTQLNLLEMWTSLNTTAALVQDNHTPILCLDTLPQHHCCMLRTGLFREEWRSSLLAWEHGITPLLMCWWETLPKVSFKWGGFYGAILRQTPWKAWLILVLASPPCIINDHGGHCLLHIHMYVYAWTQERSNVKNK